MSFFDPQSRHPQPFGWPSFEHIPNPSPAEAILEEGPNWLLHGLHRQSGQWVTIAEFGPGVDKKAVLRSVGTGGQPAIENCWLRFEDFSLFKAENVGPVTTFQYLRT